MSDAVWLPGLVVLAAGTGLALFMIWRLKGQKSAAESKARAGGPEVADLELKVRDLVQRRDDLYERIRRLQRGDETGDLASIEIEAARTLMQLDEVVAQLPHAVRKRVARRSGLQPLKAEAGAADAADATAVDAGDGASARPSASTADRSFFGAHPLLAGFAFGIGIAALIGALIYFAVADAKPKPEQMGGPPPAADTAGLPQDVSAQLDALKARLEADPNDIGAKKEIALLLLQAGKWVEAFEVGGMILQDNPADPDGLYVQGVVRLRMGQSETAVNVFDEILANWPQHIPAMLYRGLAFYQGGKVEQAVDTWEFALDRSGDMRPQFERLLSMVERGEDPLAAIGFTSQSAEHPTGNTGPEAMASSGSMSSSANAPSEAADARPTTAVAETAQTAAERPMPSGDPSGYTVRVGLAEGVQPPAGAVLFVYLRPGESGPPVAVKRVPAAAFPIDLFLGADDSMMGSALPESGNLVIRLDADGNVMSRGPSDLETTQPASLGDALRIDLGS